MRKCGILQGPGETCHVNVKYSKLFVVLCVAGLVGVCLQFKEKWALGVGR